MAPSQSNLWSLPESVLATPVSLWKVSLRIHRNPFLWSMLMAGPLERLREVTVVAALPLLTNFLTLFGMLAVMVWLNWQLALIAISRAAVRKAPIVILAEPTVGLDS